MADGASIAEADGSTDKYTVAPPFKDGSTNRSDTLADVAMHYWKTDLRTDLSQHRADLDPIRRSGSTW